MIKWSLRPQKPSANSLDFSLQDSKKIQINEKTIDNEVKKVLASNISDDTEVNLSEILVYQNENIPNEEIIAKIKQEIRENDERKIYCLA